MKKTLFLLLSTLIITNTFGQIDSAFNCGTDFSTLSKEEQALLNQVEKSFLARKLSNANFDSTTIYTIPVVFHVFHLGEPIGSGANVSLDYIQNYIKRLNDGFRARGLYFGKTPDTKIQFVLASRNPKGDYSNGITRQDGRVLAGYEQNGVNHTNSASYSSLTNVAEWDVKAYININLFHSIVSAGAFASTSIYMQIGNSDNFNTWQSAYIHEMGHSLNLAHTFEGDNNGNSCPPNNNPELDGDKITDTPPHIRYEASAANAVNSCTGQITGSVYNNFMSYNSYSFVSKLFSRGQIQRMRSMSFEEITRKELLFTYGLSQRNDSITYCQPSIPANSTWYASVNLSNFFGKNYGFLHQKKTTLGTIYVQSGQLSQLNISLSHNTSPSSTVKVYLDIDRNGEFNESTEILFSSNSTYSITGNLILPNTLEVYKTYRMRIVFAPNSNSTACLLIGIQPASTLFIGRILDVDLVPTSPDCNLTIPEIETNSQRIKRGDFGILEASNCINGKVYWFADSLKLFPLAEGNRLFTNSLQANTSYFAACKINECWSKVKKTTIYIDDQISKYQIQTRLISVGTSTTLVFDGCTGSVKWYCQETGGASIYVGSSFITPNLSQNTTYFAECFNNTSAKQKNRIIGLVLITSNDIVLKTSIEINICNSSTFPNIYPILSKTTSSSALYSIVFLKNSKQVFKSRLYPTYINSTTIDHNLYFEEINFPESGVYDFYVTTGIKTSQMGTIIIRKSYTVSNTINNIESSYIQKCTNATIRLTCQPKYGQGTIPNNSEFSFQWFKDNTLINGANQNFIDISQSGNYTTVVNNGGCVQNSFGAYVVNSGGLNNNFIQVDQRQTEPFCSGDTIRLNSHYNSTTASYIWYKNNVVIPTLNTPSIFVYENAKYSVQVTDPNCSNSPIGNTHKNVQSLDEIKIRIAASDTVVCNSLNVWISLLDYNQFTKDYKIDWYKDDELVLTGTLDITNMKSMTTREAGRYYAIITYKDCSSKTNTIQIIENASFQTPIVKLSNVSCGTATLSTNTNVQWFRNDILIGQGFSISINQTGVYQAKRFPITSCTGNSLPMNITSLNSFSTKITTGNDKRNLCGPGDIIMLNQDYYPNCNYKWRRDNVEIANGSAQYLFISVPGVYECEISNGICTTITEPITITSGSSNLSLMPTETSIWCSDRGNSISISGYNYNTSTGISWFKNGVQIQNAEATTLYISESGNYSASVNQFGCTANTPEILVSYQKPVVNFVTTGVVETGQMANLSVQNCNGQVFWYKNFDDIEYISSGSSYQTEPLFNNTQYYISCYENNCLSNKIPANIMVCSSSVIFTNSITSGIYKSSDLIESSVNTPTNTIFQAAKKIILKPGFEAGSNEFFEAKIGGCQN